MPEIDYQDRRRAMVQFQLRGRGIRDPRVLEAFGRVARERFLPQDMRPYAYEDYPLAIGEGQTISQPYVVAYMIEQLALKGSERLLEIGTGSGYQTALLAELAGQVCTIEFFPSLAARAGQLLAELGYAHIAQRVGDGRTGWPEQAPFDAIIGSAAPAEIPLPLVEQLSPQGRLILPVGSFRQHLVLVQRTPAGVQHTRLLPVRFVPMQRGTPPGSITAPSL
jgi:protein-L-isoaspartate(D-aspartate) O-methyltransferase